MICIHARYDKNNIEHAHIISLQCLNGAAHQMSIFCQLEDRVNQNLRYPEHFLYHHGLALPEICNSVNVRIIANFFVLLLSPNANNFQLVGGTNL